jgi:tartrate-resistant acid phosphatase type 5
LTSSNWKTMTRVVSIILCILLLGQVLAKKTTLLDTAGSLVNSIFRSPANPLVRFAVIGDFGRSGKLNQSEVANTMGNMCASRGCDFIISTGDNIYDTGARDANDPKFSTCYEQVYAHPGLQGIKWFMTLGNHDYRLNPQAQVEYAKTSKRWHLPDRFYKQDIEVRQVTQGRKSTNEIHFEKGGKNALVNLNLVILDTTPLNSYYYTSGTMNITAMKELNITKQREFYNKAIHGPSDEWRIVIGHHPLYSAGRHLDNADIINEFSSTLTKDLVDVYFCGHDHNIQHLVAGGTDMIISGAGSKAAFDVHKNANHKYLKSYQEESGFVYVSLFKHEMVIEFVNLFGEITHKLKINK